MKNERGRTCETRLAALSELPEINDFNSGPLTARTRNDTRAALFERVSRRGREVEKKTLLEKVGNFLWNIYF